MKITLIYRLIKSFTKGCKRYSNFQVSYVQNMHQLYTSLCIVFEHKIVHKDAFDDFDKGRPSIFKSKSICFVSYFNNMLAIISLIPQ